MRFEMKWILSLIFISFFSSAQQPPLGTSRSEDLQLKAKIDYEKRNQKKPQSKFAPTPAQSANSPVKSAEPAPPTSTPAPAAAGKNLTCKNGGEVRELYIESKGNGCELFYTKSGVTKSQARQSNGKNICESVFEQVKSTIEKTGFVCEPKTN
jgi:hypothetical protein